jgi:hypothetical protein
MTGHIVHHLVRRGVNHLTKEQYIQKLQNDAHLYEKSGEEINPREFLPVVITAIITALILWSISYTIGEVISSLAMIESPTRTAIIDAKPPPPYTDEADAPLEKEPLLVAEDIEVSLVEHKAITSKITSTIGHLHRIGGFRARWRGLGLSIFYHFLHSLIANFLASVIGLGLIGEAFTYMFVSVGLARIHMAWTHKMISYPTSQWWFRRVPARKDCRQILLPALVYAAAQQATIILPIGVAFALGLGHPEHDHFKNAVEHHDCSKMALLGLRVLAVPATYIVVGLAVLLPASVTLTRIEATLLPEGEEAIVNFDKAAVMGDIDVKVRGGARALFVQAWRSFDRSSRLRVIKLYAKMILAQVTIIFVSIHLMVAELYVIGGERIALFMKSAAAQLKLMAIKAHDAHEAQGN